MSGITVTGDQVVVIVAVLVSLVLIAVAGRVLLAAAVIVGMPMAGDPLPVGQHHPGVGGPRGPGAVGRVHAGRRADRHDRPGLGVASPARWWSAMSTDDTEPPTGTSVQKRPPAELVSRPTTLAGARRTDIVPGPAGALRDRSTQRGSGGARLAHPHRAALAGPQQPDLSAGRGVGADPPRLGSTHPRPVRTTTPHRGGGRGSGPAG